MNMDECQPLAVQNGGYTVTNNWIIGLLPFFFLLWDGDVYQSIPLIHLRLNPDTNCFGGPKTSPFGWKGWFLLCWSNRRGVFKREVFWNNDWQNKKSRMTRMTYIPTGSVYGIFTYTYHKNQPNVGKYTIHGWYGIYTYHTYIISHPRYGRRFRQEYWTGHGPCGGKWYWQGDLSKVSFQNTKTSVSWEWFF